MAEWTQNRVKILWSMNHLMRDDPRRRFVLGFTIEDVDMRLWFCSRSDVFASQSFDFMKVSFEACYTLRLVDCRHPKDHKRTVDFFLRILFATEVELGWDDTIELTKHLDPEVSVQRPTWDITVRNHDDKTTTIYRTQKVISNFAADAIRGRGTRVWLVKKLDESGEEVGDPLVLKDSWIDADRIREGEILRKLRDHDASAALDKYLLNTENWGDVYIEGSQDHTVTLLRKGADLPEADSVLTIRLRYERPLIVSGQVEAQGVTENPETRGLTEMMPMFEERVNYSAKVHHRIVFREVGKTIDKVESLREIFRHLADVVKGVSQTFLSLVDPHISHRIVSNEETGLATP